jgi:hypothetical protein
LKPVGVQADQHAAKKVLYFAAGGNLENMRSSESSRFSELSGLLKRDESYIELRRYVGSSLSA